MKARRLLLYPLIVLFIISCKDESVLIDLSVNDPNPFDPNFYENHCATPVFSINLTPGSCTVDIEELTGQNGVYIEAFSGKLRTVTINGIANHPVGEFPNTANPNRIASVSETFILTTAPDIAGIPTPVKGYTFGVVFSGVSMDPYTDAYFEGPNGPNFDWNITALQDDVDLGLDCNNAHVQSDGKYRYHATPTAFTTGLGIDGSEMRKIGYAADGFPVYYKYGYDSNGNDIIPLQSGYRLKSTDRGGDGKTAPSGCPDGLYFKDYQYVLGQSTLDACNGRFGKTPEAEEEYYYVITDNFPSIPLCFAGTPNESFRNTP